MIAPLPGLAGLAGDRAIVSDRRAEKRDGTWHLAEQVILDEVTAVAEVAAGWVFQCVASPSPDPEVGVLHWAADGTLFGVARLGRTRHLVAGRPDAPLVATALPARADLAVLADAQRGYAWGPAVRVLWRTLDGGAHWESLPTPVDGERDEGTSSWHASSCEGDRCSVGTWTVDGWGPIEPTTPVAFALRASARAPTPDPSPTPLSPDAVLRCTTETGVVRLPAGAPVPAEVVDGGNPWFDDFQSARARRFAWEVNGQRRGPLLVPEESTVLAVSTRGVLVRVGQPSEAWWLSAGGGRRRVEAPPAAMGTWEHVARGLPSSDGGVVLLMNGEDSVGTLVRLDAQGAVVAVRARRTSDGYYGLARVGGHWGLATPSPDGGTDLVALDVEALGITSLPRIADLPPVCAPDAEAETAVVHLADRGLLVISDGAGTDFQSARLDVAFRGGAWCTRGLVMDSFDDNYTTNRSTLVLRASGGALRGHVDHGTERRGLRCEVVP